MNKFYGLVLAGLILPGMAFAQSLQEQINAVDAVISEQNKHEAELQAKELKRQQAAQAVKAQEKKRQQAYDDKIKDMQLEEKALELETKRLRAKRSNEFIDQELKRQAVETDVIQSEADANRNISSGIGENLKSQGRAAEIKAKK